MKQGWGLALWVEETRKNNSGTTKQILNRLVAMKFD
jgi:hypothetical protein